MNDFFRHNEFLVLGIIGSALFHGGLFFGTLASGSAPPPRRVPMSVYALSLEPGKKLGGISQVGERDKSSTVPAAQRKTTKTKKESSPSPIKPKKQAKKPPATKVPRVKPTVRPTAKPTSPVKSTPLVEVSPQPTQALKRKSESDNNATPVPTAQPTFTPSPQKLTPTPAPTATTQPTPTPLPTPKPTQAPSPTAREIVVTPSPQEKPLTSQRNVPKEEEPSLDEQYQESLKKYLGDSVDAGAQRFGAGAIGARGAGGGTVVPPEFIKYKSQIDAHIKSFWRWHDPHTLMVSEVELWLDSDGAILRARIARSSGNRKFDESVFRAVMASDPLPPPPANVYERYFSHIILVFDPQG